jgi:tetratricopeptide (TPR) repeat protein
MAGLVAFAAHSGLVQAHTQLGRRAYQHVAVDRDATAAVQVGLHHLGRGRALALLANPYDLVKMARLSLRQGDGGEYERRMLEAIQELPGDTMLLTETGDFYAARGRLDPAVAMYRSAVERDPDLVEAYVNIGRFAAKLGRTDEARAAFETAMARDPQLAVAPFNFGVLESLVGRHDEAIALFERAVELDPGFIEARENLAGMYCQAGRFREGIAQFNEALKARPNDPQTHELVARAYLALRQYPQAETHLVRALEVDPGYVPARQMLEALEAQRGSAGNLTVEDEVAGNILGQAVGNHTLESFALPDAFVRRAADRVIRSTYRQRFRQVFPGEAGGETGPLPPDGGEPRGLIEVHRIDRPAGKPRQSMLEGRPPLRGFRAPIGAEADRPWPFDPPPASAPTYLRQASRVVAERLAVDGVLPTVARVIEVIGPNRVLAAPDDGFEMLRATGLPVDLIGFYALDGARRGDAASVVRALARRLAEGRSAGALAPELETVAFEFAATRPGFQVATESGEHEIGLLRLQLTRGTHWRGPGAGGCLDLAGQLVAALPETEFVASIEQRHLEPFLGLAGRWALRRPGRLTVIAEPLVVSQWAQDNGKAGLIVDDQRASRQVAMIVPRYASRNEDGSVFVPNESFLIDGLASIGMAVIHSPLLFQGGNLLAVGDPGTGRRVLLIGEAELHRNTAMGLNAEQVLGAFRIEFGVDQAVVLPAVSFHIDYDVTVRAHGGRVIAFVNDMEAAEQIILGLGLEGLEAHGTLDEAEARAARAHLGAGRGAELVRLIRPRVLATLDDRGRFPLSLAQQFTATAVDSPIGNLQRFLAALDGLTSRALGPDELPPNRHARSYFRSLQRRRADREALHRQLADLGWEVVAVPSLADAEVSINAINGLHTPGRYLMPAYGGFYRPLDEAAVAAFRAVLGNRIQVTGILCGESQRRVGAVHCSVMAYPAP